MEWGGTIAGAIHARAAVWRVYRLSFKYDIGSKLIPDSFRDNIGMMYPRVRAPPYGNADRLSIRGGIGMMHLCARRRMAARIAFPSGTILV